MILDKYVKIVYNKCGAKAPQNGPVKVSTGILKQDKRGVSGNHVKGLTLKLNANNNVAMAA